MASVGIIGGGGFIGQHLCRHLARQGVEVLASHQPGRAPPRIAGVSWLPADVTDPETWNRWPGRCDNLVYLAQARDYRSFPAGAPGMFGVNVKGLMHCLDYAQRAGTKRFLLASTGSVYRAMGKPAREGDAVEEMSPRSFYAASKLAAECLLRPFQELFHVINLRLFMPYGAGQNPDMLIPSLVRKVQRGEAISLQGQEGLTANPIAALDVARTIGRCLELDRSVTLNVAGAEIMTLRKIGLVLGQVMGREPLFLCQPEQTPPCLVGDIAALKKTLGWGPPFLWTRVRGACWTEKPSSKAADREESLMCGIAGVCYQNGQPIAASVLQRMTKIIAHRGPDGEGQYIDGNVGLGHRRLAIIDLSPLGHQPMANETGDVVIVFNGEIYNFQQLRIELEACGHRFHSQTDTEAIVHAYEQWGEECVHRFNGMFAFAIWDRGRRQLFLARDKYGIKPLYWYYRGGTFLFGSEIKSILEHPGVARRVNPCALDEYFSFQNIFTDQTLFDGVRLLPPAQTLTLKTAGNSAPVQRCYWDYPFAPEVGSQSEEQTVDQVYRLFERAVTKQLISDVPIGSYLSGGMDSGSITSIAARHVNRLTTFTGGFDLTSASGMEMGFDERRSAEMMSHRLKTEHYEVVMHAGDMEWVLPRLIWHLEDLRVGQCYPNYYVARLAGKFVKVVLSGAGGDELFGGYPWRYYRGMDSLNPQDYFQRYYQFWQRLVPDEAKTDLFLPDIRRELRGHSTFDVFRNVFQTYRGGWGTREDYLNASLYFELKTFLHGLLVVEDKLSMAHSLETRVPFLEDDLVECAVRIPARFKVRNIERAPHIDENIHCKRQLYESQTSDGKVILRSAMSRFIPPEVTARSKQGFSAPDASWFRGESIDYINRLLRNPRAHLYDYINPKYVFTVLDEHCSGRINRRLLIWSFLSLEWWLKNFIASNSMPYSLAG